MKEVGLLAMSVVAAGVGVVPSPKAVEAEVVIPPEAPIPTPSHSFREQEFLSLQQRVKQAQSRAVATTVSDATPEFSQRVVTQLMATNSATKAEVITLVNTSPLESGNPLTLSASTNAASLVPKSTKPLQPQSSATNTVTPAILSSGSETAAIAYPSPIATPAAPTVTNRPTLTAGNLAPAAANSGATNSSNSNSVTTNSVNTAYVPPVQMPDFTIPNTPRPSSGIQQYRQRLAALRAGTTYTRLPVNSFQESWINASGQPTYEQWVNLLRWEAQSMARGQGNNRLSVMLGDSISQWFPTENLTGDRFWLNQGISGDTTTGVMRRLNALNNVRPDTIHLMIGINDLRRGASDADVLNNILAIAQRLRQQHPQARILLYSLLPTRMASLPSDRIQRLNQVIERIAQYTNSEYLDLYSSFTDETGVLNRDLTTDGLHLSRQGYGVWRSVLDAVG